MRSFEGGAIRNIDAGKLDYEGFLSPFALRAYCEYLDSHRLCADGTMRDSDNWQSGFGPGVCMKSLMRHVWDAWMIHRGGQVIEDGGYVTKKEALCAAAFNIMSQLHDMEKPDKPKAPPKRKAALCSSFGKEKLPPCVKCDSDCTGHPDYKEELP
jgi:hypothetical protein